MASIQKARAAVVGHKEQSVKKEWRSFFARICVSSDLIAIPEGWPMMALTKAFSSEVGTGSCREPKVRVSEYANIKTLEHFPDSIEAGNALEPEAVVTRAALSNYLKLVIKDDFAAMADGKESRAVTKALNSLYAAALPSHDRGRTAPAGNFFGTFHPA